MKLQENAKKIPALIRNFFNTNAEKNRLNREANKMRADLLDRMEAEGIKEFPAEAVVDGKRVRLEASVNNAEVTEVNLRRLLEICGNVDEFLPVVTVTKSSVVEKLGEAVWEEISTKKEDPERRSVSVKKAKK